MIADINGLKVYTSEKLNEYKDKLKYYVTTRLGGISKFPYESLNISFKNVSDRENSKKNLDLVCDNLGFERNNCIGIYEDHTDNILVITEENKDEYLFDKFHNHIYDAIITDVKNIPLIITIADCNAIVMYDTKNNVVANIHSGWKGTIKKIYLKTHKRKIVITTKNNKTTKKEIIINKITKESKRATTKKIVNKKSNTYRWIIIPILVILLSLIGFITYKNKKYQ